METYKCQPTIDNPCLTADEIVNGGGEIMHQLDGSVSVWINTDSGVVPYNNANTKICCEYLGYVFDIENQKCLWSDPISCDTCEMKIVINPNGDDGDYFTVNENSECSLDITLDYTFKFDCSILASGETINEDAIAIESDIESINHEIESAQLECAALSGACFQYNSIYTAMCYTILVTNHVSDYDANPYYNSVTPAKTPAGTTSVSTPLSGDMLALPSRSTVCCLTEEGLIAWQAILGDVKYNAWLASNGCDTTIYTNQQSQTLYTDGNNIALETNSPNPYFSETSDGICDKQNAYEEMLSVCGEYQACLDIIAELQTQLGDLQNELANLETEGILCNDPIANLENFTASFSLDVETDTPMLYETVYEEQIFGIGEGNLMQYIIDSGSLTGIIISGETGVLPGFSVETTCTYDEICKSKRDEFIRQLYLTEYLPNFGAPENNLENTELLQLMGGWYNSAWLSYGVTINDPAVIEQIKNKKIRISIKVNTCCLDFALLLDKIKVTQNCESIDNTFIKISKPFGFELEKFVDNKKSWVSNELPEKRLHLLHWRNTEYPINDHRLAINTKEIDLNIDPAKAIEGDVFKYAYNNPCVLDYTGSSISLSGYCGGDYTDISSKLMTPLSEVNTVEEFERIVYSELIDAKTRQSITAYPLLRLLYERYLSNTLCNGISNGYNYDSMQNISQLVGDYWVDLIEQFVPATTIWGSTFIYRNSVFDTQKYTYKSNTLWLCENPSPYFPFSAISSDCNTQVIKVDLSSDTPPASGSTPFDSTNFFSCNQYTYCDCVWTMTNYCDSEFIGRIIGDEEYASYCETNLLIETVPLVLNLITVPGCNAFNQTWDSINRIFSQTLKITDTSFIPVTTEYNYDVMVYGNNMNSITLSVTKLNTSTIRIDWVIPIASPDPILTSCPGYYTNYDPTTSAKEMFPIWDIIPIVIVTEPEFNCEITRLFIKIVNPKYL